MRQYSIQKVHTSSNYMQRCEPLHFSPLATLTAQAYACVYTYGEIHTGLDVVTAVTITDNGETVCDGCHVNRGGPGDVKCQDGYSAHYEIGTAGDTNSMGITYGMPHGTFYITVPPLGQCTYSNCCGGKFYFSVDADMQRRRPSSNSRNTGNFPYTCSICKNANYSFY
ncbi:hypothetical protein ISF_01423 [Cordyceps fumosorosea ARSEF 2679]|uniref:Uncharacterized protein n=1 Tax=Cordyceps fumosorosea (strain ARSEF 2679) TaxID=1081104 RepID=A0A168DA69_CORFA|nr:hypothetical protein ISF_01423 [Cordyceps fumosorosea ARSEF 2679]OAA72350.1 hypothetical protein ISF_01423 [Cordyceps fumosorosea ARSEF 2679]